MREMGDRIWEAGCQYAVGERPSHMPFEISQYQAFLEGVRSYGDYRRRRTLGP